MKNIAPSEKKVGTQSEIRENTMICDNNYLVIPGTVKWLSGTYGRSITIAAIATIAALLLAPQAALADNECNPPADPSVNGATADNYVCDDPIGTYTNGVTYSSDGDLRVESTVDGNEFGGNGIRLIGNGADDVEFFAADGAGFGGDEIEGRDLVGALLDLSSDIGDITITADDVDADAHNASGVTHAIRAISAGGGGISITNTGQVAATSGVSPDAIGIEARSTGGDIFIDGDAPSGSSGITGEAYGILAETSGAGSVTMILDGVGADAGNGVAAVDATAGTGGLDITLVGSISFEGTAIIGRSTGGATIDVLQGSLGDVSFELPDGGGTVDFSGVTGGGVTLTFAGASDNQGRWLATGDSVLSGEDDIVVMGGVGENFLGLHDDFMSDDASIDFGAGDDIFDMQAFFNMGVYSDTGASMDFGAGDDSFAMSGVFSPSGASTLSNLEAFEHSGVIFMGPSRTPNGQILWTETDDHPDDRLSIPGATFTGSGDARVVMDISLLDETVQAGCITPTVADCIDLSGGSTAGSTILSVNYVGLDNTAGAYNPIGVTLVDVSGGTSAAEHFVLDPNTEGYMVDPIFGPSIDRLGLFRYALRYDADNQRHVLAGLPQAEALEYIFLGSAAQSIWHQTAEVVAKRRTDLVDTQEGALWMRVINNYGSRDLTSRFDDFGTTRSVNHDYRLETEALMGGADLISGSYGGVHHVIGIQMGYARADADLRAGTASAKFSGATVGAYASAWNDRFFVDSTLHSTFLALNYNSPAFAKSNTRTETFGFHLEGGMHLDFREGYFVEPLVTLARSRTRFEKIKHDGAEIEPEADGMRGALGARLGRDFEGDVLVGNYFLTGRAWDRFEGDASSTIVSAGPDFVMEDDFSGSMHEVEAGLSLRNKANTVSGYITAGSKKGDDYEMTNISVGMTLRW